MDRERLHGKEEARVRLAKAPTAPACLAASVSKGIRKRLDDPPLSPQESLPSPVIAVTESRTDDTPVWPFEVTSTVSVPRKLPSC
jgi:hypothetical protein